MGKHKFTTKPGKVRRRKAKKPKKKKRSRRILEKEKLANALDLSVLTSLENLCLTDKTELQKTDHLEETLGLGKLCLLDTRKKKKGKKKKEKVRQKSDGLELEPDKAQVDIEATTELKEGFIYTKTDSKKFFRGIRKRLTRDRKLDRLRKVADDL